MTRAARRRLGGAALGALLASACTPSDPSKAAARYRLEGSLTQVMDLGYDEVRVILAPQDVSLLFVRQRPLEDAPDDGGVQEEAGLSEDYPLKVGWALGMDMAPSGGRVDLTEEDADGNQRGVVSRNVLNDPRKLFPRLARGTLSFSRPPEPDTTVSGDFHCTFENGIEAASGRTVFANFTARVVTP